MVNKLFLVHVDLHGEPLPAAAIALHEGDNTLGKNADNEIKPSSAQIDWGRNQAIIRIMGTQVEIQDLGSTGKTFYGEDIESIKLVPKKSARPLKIGNVIVLGKKDYFDRFRLVSELPPTVHYEELQFIPSTLPLQPTPPHQVAEIVSSKQEVVDVDTASNSHPDPSHFPNMNISINYPTNNPNPVSIRIEGSPAKQYPVASSLPDSAPDEYQSEGDGSKVRKSLSFLDEVPGNVPERKGPVALSLRAPIEAPKTSSLKNSLRTEIGPDLVFPPVAKVREAQTLAGVSFADSMQSENNVINRIVGPISRFPDFDATSIPDYVLLEAVAENVLSSKETSVVQLQMTILELKELHKQCRAGAATDDSLLHNQVSGEFDIAFRDLVIAILSNAVNCSESLLRNNLFLSLKVADEEKYDIGAYKVLLTNRDRLVELHSYYQLQTKSSNFKDNGSSNQHLFEILTCSISPIVADLDKIRSILEFINRQGDDSSKAKKMVARTNSLTSQLTELRSLKGKHKLMRRALSYLDNAIMRQNLKAFNCWKLLVKLSRNKSCKSSAARK
jgi:hypothetical protein